MAVQDYVARFRNLIHRNTPLLAALSDEASAARPALGKWSPREVLGHLVDSASNNHQRFVRAQFRDDLVFEGYEQDGWVERQGYQDAPWPELVALWRTFNLHLARVMERAPEGVRTRSRMHHNLHRIGFGTVREDEPATLDWFMADYVDHLEHHLRQILGDQMEAGA